MCWWIRLIFLYIAQTVFCLFILLSCFNNFQTSFFCCWPISFSPQRLLYHSSPVLSSSCCCLSDLLVHGSLTGFVTSTILRFLCRPFFLFEFCVLPCVWNALLLRVFQYLSSFLQKCKFECRFIYLSSFLVSHIWILSFATPVICLDKPFTPCSLPLLLMGKDHYFFFEASLWVPVSLAEHWIFSPCAPASLPWLPTAVSLQQTSCFLGLSAHL